MNKLRVAAAATAIALLAAFASMGSASAATNGVGTTETATSLLDVALGSSGSLLHLRVLGDDAKTTVDPAVGPTSAFAQMFAVKATSSVVSLLNNVSVPNPPLETRTPGGAGSVTGPALNLSNAIPGLGSLPLLGSSLLSGSLAPAALSSSITDGVAKSGLQTSLANVGLVGGLLSIDSVSNNLGAQAAGLAADGTRSLGVNAVSVLDLGALLNGLGIDLTNLPIPAVSSILDQLNIPLAGVPATETLTSFVQPLFDTLNAVTGVNGGTQFSGLTSGAQSTINGALGGLGTTPVGSILSGGSVVPATTVTSLVDTVQSLLTDTLGSALSALDNLTLLKFNGLNIGAVTHAVAGTSDSKADVIGTLGGVSIGGLNLPGLDLGSALSTVSGLVTTITDTVDGVLGSVAPDLAGILSVKFFDKYADNGVSSSAGYTRALAGITGVKVGINPPANLAAIVSSLLPASGIGSAITGNGGSLPVLGGLMDSLTGSLVSGGATGLLGALTGGATIKIADVSAGSNFAAAASPAQVSTLPRTGANTTVFLVIGMLMVGGVIVGRRFIPVRTESDIK